MGDDFMQALRARAELRLSTTEPAARSPREQDAGMRELRMHQVELELQNESLRETQLSLLKSQSLYEEVFELAPVAYLRLDDDGRVIEANRAAEVILGTDAASLFGSHLSALICEEHVLSFARHRRDVLTLDETQVLELQLRPRNGPVRDVRIESRRAQSTRWLCALIDVTERNALQRRVQEAERLQALGTLTGGVAHDFNNTLTVILGCTQLANERLSTPEHARKALLDLQAAAEHARDMTQQLLGAGRRTVESPSTELHAALLASEPLLRRVLGADVKLSLDLGATETRVIADTGLLEQVLFNLVRNACDAMAHDGRLRIATQDVASGDLPALALRTRRYCLLSVTDDGCGMSEEVRAHAFEPFFTTKPSRLGSGLGLWMVHGTIQSAGGFLELQSNPGQGTTLRLYLLCDERAAASR